MSYIKIKSDTDNYVGPSKQLCKILEFVVRMSKLFAALLS